MVQSSTMPSQMDAFLNRYFNKDKNQNKKSITIQQFIKESIAELKKVVWPSRKQVKKLTIIVIGVSLFTGAFIGILDYVFTKLIGSIIK